MTTRRLFIQIVPVSAAGLLAACSDKAPPPAPVAATPAPVAAAPAPVPAPAPAAAPAAASEPVAAGPMVDEKDATAAALGYVAEASRVDKVKYAKFADGQACGSCALFQGAAAASGPCPLFPGKQVSAKGWCGSYAKKAT